MQEFHLRLTRGKTKNLPRITAIDTEWAKHWKAAEKFVPFCTSIHSVYFSPSCDRIVVERLGMESELYFRGADQDTAAYVEAVDALLAKYLDGQTTLVGHQISSDLHTLTRSTRRSLPAVSRLIELFRNRKMARDATDGPLAADTRYDISNRVRGDGGERLRTVSLRLGIVAVQTELDSDSLTALYDRYVRENNHEVRERLMVLNWRHAFQTSLVWLVNRLPDRRVWCEALHAPLLVTNHIMHTLGRRQISYLRTPDFAKTMTPAGIVEYCRRYDVNIPLLPTEKQHVKAVRADPRRAVYS